MRVRSSEVNCAEPLVLSILSISTGGPLSMVPKLFPLPS